MSQELSMVLDFGIKVDIYKMGFKRIMIISDYDYVFYSEVYKVNLEFNIESDTTIKVKGIKTETTFIDYEIYDEINVKFKKLFGKYPDYHKLDEYGLKRKRIGASCGITGMPTYYASRFFKPTAKKDIHQLNNWLTSINPIHQINGYLGLKFIERDGETLSQNQIRIMKHLEKRTTMIHTCRGCLVGMKDPMNKLISKQEIKSYWFRYNQYLEEINENNANLK